MKKQAEKKRIQDEEDRLLFELWKDKYKDKIKKTDLLNHYKQEQKDRGSLFGK